jgi:DNA-binding MarR family transcriptional regulator
MRDGDAADSVEASYERHPVEDLEPVESPTFLSGMLKDAVCRWKGDLPRTMAEMKVLFFLIIDDALAEGVPQQEPESLDAIAELLQRFATKNDGQLYAYSYLLVLNRCPYSEAEIARRLGITKAAVSKVKRQIEEQLQLKSRTGRTEASCEKFRQLRIGKRKERQTTWAASSLFLQAT